MKRFASILAVCCLTIVLRPDVAAAQGIPGLDWAWSNTADRVDPNHVKMQGAVEIWRGASKFNADVADYYIDEHRLIASGHVTVAEADSADGPPSRSISAEAMDFNTDTQTGIFYNAWGMASLGNRVDRSMFGTLEPDMYFYGETIEKLGRKKYRITNGGFTTCVQPVPRWELTSGSVVISLEHYAVLRNPVLRVKGVPLFYVPFLYYPVKTKDDRSTGFLMPTYGTSTIRGFTLSNAFFWAMGRSADLTILHDLFTRTGQGIGTQYRYVRGAGSQGDFSTYVLNEHAVTTTAANGVETTTQPKRSYDIRGSANEVFNKHLRAGGRISYFSDIVTQQTYNLNIYDASRSNRTINANVLGSFGTFRVTGSIDRNEVFSGTTSSGLSAATPRIGWSRSELPIAGLPVYLRLGGEFVQLQRGSSQTGTDGKTIETNQSLGRVDFNPTIRVPFTKLAFLSVNSSVSWRGTYWTKSWDASQNLLDQSISRRLFVARSEITGPVFNRIFDTANSGYAEKLKHTIEPFLTVDYTTRVDNFNSIVRWEAIDGIVGGTGTMTYGFNNRVFAKLKRDGQVLPSREILSVSFQQTYYTNVLASQYDRSYNASFSGSAPFSFSPIAMTARALPTDRINVTSRAEWDSHYGLLRSISANGGYSAGNWLNVNGGWTLTRSIGADGTVNQAGLSNFLSAATNLRLHENKYGGNYSFNYDMAKGEFVQQRITGYYNAQCCGFAIEYQMFNFGNLAIGVPQDRRFNFSFTLAGLGSFSNFFGALGGAPR